LGKTREQALVLFEQRRPVYESAKVHVEFREETFEDLVGRIVVLFTSSA